jgi:hypothetical protein
MAASYRASSFYNWPPKDPWFAWLRHISWLVVQIDEVLDADEEVLTGKPVA